MGRAFKSVLVVAAVVLLPSLASAQGTLTGTVRDQSGGVLPGVTVDASSPALIEKVRTAVTDDTGQYRITGLNPGTYSLTFRMPPQGLVCATTIEITANPRARSSHVSRPVMPPQYRGRRRSMTRSLECPTRSPASRGASA